MKLSANIMAYVVLVAAVVLVGVYVTGIDTSTDVSTVEESLLPNVYPPEGQSITPDIQGVSFRYPARWQISGSGDTLLMTRPVDRFDESAGQYSFDIQVSQQAGDEALTPANLVPEDIGDAEITELERGGLPALRTVQTAEDGSLTVTDYVQLSDENVFLQMSNQTPLSRDAWDDISGDIDGMLNSIKAEDVVVFADAFTFTLPEDWVEFNNERIFFTALTPDAQNPTAGVQVAVFPPDQAVIALSRILQVTQGTIDLTIAPDPMTAIELYAELPEHPVEITEELQDVTLFGYDGKQIEYTSPELNRVRVSVLDSEDGNYVVVLANILTGEEYEVYADGIDALLDSVEYTTPDPSLFGQ